MQLATIMRLNALSCVGFGAVLAVLPAPVAAFLGTAPVDVLRVLGIALLGNGGLLWLAVRQGRSPRRHEVAFFCAGDLGWVVATVLLIGAGLWITTTQGRLAAVVVAAGVGTMGALQWRYLPRA